MPSETRLFPFARRGVTLIELLLAIAVLVALGSLVVPAAVERFNERAFESAAEILRDQLLLARAHALVESEPVEVTYEPQAARVVATRFRQGASGDDDDAPPPPITAAWAERPLADGMWVDDRAAPDERLDPPQRTRLAVYMADGSALVGGACRLGDAHGRLGRIEVNPWTGLPAWERLDGADLAAEEASPPDQARRELPEDDQFAVPEPAAEDQP